MGMWQKSMIAVACSKPLRAIGEAIGHKTGLADQFVSAGDVAGHVARAEALARDGIRVSSFYLGEYVTDLSQVRETVARLDALVPVLDQTGLDVHISIDPSQLGYMQDQAILDRNVDHLAAKLNEIGLETPHRTIRLMIDMEDIDMVDDTLRLHHRLADGGYQVAQTLQARLHRTKADLRDMIARGAMVRLVKGAMAPPDDVAFTKREDIDENYFRLSTMMLSAEAKQNGFFPVFGTHDRKLAWAIIEHAKAQGWSPEQFEFEMLYGVNQPLQRELAAAGHRLRLYAPFGKDWWAYAWRRVGENPRNLGLLMRSSMSKGR